VRGGRRTVFLSLREDPSAAPVASWVRDRVTERLAAQPPTVSAP